MNPITQLSDVALAGASPVSLVGELHVREPLTDPDTGTTYAALRTDVGFTVQEMVSRGTDTKQTWVFRVAKCKTQTGAGLHLTTEDGRVELEPERLKLEQETSYTTSCSDVPVGFEEAMDSPHSTKGQLGRRDHRLLPGDRVEFLGRVERTQDGGYRSVGEYELRDLSTGQRTQAEENARDRRIIIMLLVAVVVVAGGITAATTFFS